MANPHVYCSCLTEGLIQVSYKIWKSTKMNSSLSYHVMDTKSQFAGLMLAFGKEDLLNKEAQDSVSSNTIGLTVLHGPNPLSRGNLK